MRLGAVLMASGFGRRFGENKLLYPVDGVPMVERAFRALPPALFDRAVVVSACPEILTLGSEAGYLTVFNPGAAEGRAASVRLGLERLKDMDGVLFAVCDQPWLRRESVEKLLADFFACPDSVCALAYEGRRGNPMVFPAALFPELLALTGEQGGGRVLQAHPQLLRLTEAASAAELRDVDTPADLLFLESPTFSREKK